MAKKIKKKKKKIKRTEVIPAPAVIVSSSKGEEWKFIQELRTREADRNPTKDFRRARGFWFDAYLHYIEQSPPEKMEWELLKARVMSDAQLRGFRQAGKEDRLSKGFWKNYNAAWSKKAEENSIVGFDPLIRDSFMFQYSSKSEEPDKVKETVMKKVKKKKKMKVTTSQKKKKKKKKKMKRNTINRRNA